MAGAINGQTINGTSILGTTIGNTASAVNGNIHTGSAIYAGTIGNTGAVFTGSSITLTGNTSIQVNAGSLGTTSGNQLVYATLSSADSNASNLIFSETRDSAGTAWTTAASRIQNKIDTTWMGFIQFNGTNNNSGITFGTGSSTASATSISERIRIDSSGNFYPVANASSSLGGSTAYWSTIYGVSFVGTSTTAKYADLAEMYLADAQYQPGTVLIFGGDDEVTTTDISHDPRVAGIVSTNPAYLMNDNFEDGYYVPVGLTGRLPCFVQGPVKKGDILVASSIKGVAQKLSDSEYRVGCVIGKCLQNHDLDTVKKIEVVVGRF